MRAVLSIVLFSFGVNAIAQTAPLIRFGRGFAAEEQVWLMSARPDLTPNQGKRYQLKQILFQANPERFQAYLAGELDAGTAPGLAVIFARAQGMDMKIVANVCLEAGGNYFATTYMVKDDGPIKSIKDLKGGTVGVVGIKTATDLWARAGLINAGLVPDKDTKVVPMAFPVIGDAVRTGKVSAGTFVEPFYSAEMAKGDKYFTTTYMVKDDGPIKSVKDLKGGTIGVVGIKTATDLWARAGLINAGLVPDKDTKVVPMAFPVIGDAVRTGKVAAGTFVEPFYSSEMAKGGLRKLFTAVDAVGYEHELLDIFFGEKFLKAHPEAVRAFLADYVAVTKYYLANTEQAKRDLHKAGFVRTPIEIYLKNADWKRDANARVDVESLKKLSTFMHEKLQWLDKPVNVDGMVDQSYLPR